MSNTVQRAFDVKNATAGNAGVAFSGTDAGMTEEGLDITDVSAIFKEMGSESMPEAVD